MGYNPNFLLREKFPDKNLFTFMSFERNDFKLQDIKNNNYHLILELYEYFYKYSSKRIIIQITI